MFPDLMTMGIYGTTEQVMYQLMTNNQGADHSHQWCCSSLKKPSQKPARFSAHWDYTRSAQKVPTHNIWKIDIYWRRYKIQKTLYTGQWCLSPLQSRHLGTSHSPPNHHHLPHHSFLNLTDGSEISSLSKVILVLRKARSRRALNLGCRVAEWPGWFDVSPKNSVQDVMHELYESCQ